MELLRDKLPPDRRQFSVRQRLFFIALLIGRATGQRITRQQGGGSAGVFSYVEEADEAAIKVSQRPDAHPAGERIVNEFNITGNYHLQGGNLQANGYCKKGNGRLG